jgi:hypothetical protein
LRKAARLAEAEYRRAVGKPAVAGKHRGSPRRENKHGGRRQACGCGKAPGLPAAEKQTWGPPAGLRSLESAGALRGGKTNMRAAGKPAVAGKLWGSALGENMEAAGKANGQP